MSSGRHLSLVVGAAPLALRAADITREFVVDGWTVKVVTTPAGTSWVDHEVIAGLIGRPVAHEYRQPGQSKSDPRPDVIVACPLTFNTGNKLAAGAMDNYALGVLCEGVGTGTPVLAVPMVNNFLWGHPAWARNIQVLREAGVLFLDANTGVVGGAPVAVQSGTGDHVVKSFEPKWLTAALKSLPAQKS